MRKDLGELVEFMIEIEKVYTGYVDMWLCQLLEPATSSMTSETLAQEYDKSIKQRLVEQFESLVRIPFINKSNVFKKFFELGSITPINMSAENSFDKVDVSNAQGNPFIAERRLTESVPPKNTRMTLQGD